MSLGSSVGSLGIGGFFCQRVNQGFSLKSSGLYAKIYGQCQPSSWLLWASLLWRHPACTGKGNCQCWNLSCWEDGSFRSRNQQEDQRSNCCLVARCRFYFCYTKNCDLAKTRLKTRLGRMCEYVCMLRHLYSDCTLSLGKVFGRRDHQNLSLDFGELDM